MLLKRKQSAFSAVKVRARWGNPVCGIFVFLFSTMTWRLISVFFRNFSNVIPFYRRQCIPVSNYVNDVDHHTVFVLNQFKMKSFPVL